MKINIKLNETKTTKIRKGYIFIFKPTAFLDVQTKKNDTLAPPAVVSAPKTYAINLGPKLMYKLL
jgi:hypothetical protein